VEGNPYEPLDDEARAAIQLRVNEYYDIMTSDIAKNRGETQLKVKSGFGEGRIVGAKQAVNMGMADRVGTFENVLKRIKQVKNTNQKAKLQRVRQ
jgi:ClpP class serine protease